MKIIKPSISKALENVEDLLSLIRLCKEEELDITSKQISGVSFVDTDLSKICFKDVVFENCKFINCLLVKTDFIDVVFKECDLSNSNGNGSYFNRCELISCKGMGINLQNAILKDVSFINSHFKYANFDMAGFKNVGVVESDLSHANITECKLSNLALKKSLFIGTSFFKTPLKGIDLTECEIDGMLVSGEELKGLTVNVYQAAELSKLLGLVVK